MVMIVRPDGWADTQRICPDGRARERAIWSNPKGGPKWGARSVAKPGRYPPGICPARRLAIIPIATRRNDSYLRDRTLKRSGV